MTSRESWAGTPQAPLRPKGHSLRSLGLIPRGSAPPPHRRLSIDLGTNGLVHLPVEKSALGPYLEGGVAKAPCPWVGPSPSAISGSGGCRKP